MSREECKRVLEWVRWMAEQASTDWQRKYYQSRIKHWEKRLSEHED